MNTPPIFSRVGRGYISANVAFFYFALGAIASSTLWGVVFWSRGIWHALGNLVVAYGGTL